MVLVIGRGESGTAAMRLLEKKGIACVMTDTEQSPDLSGIEYAVISPGIKFDSALVRKIQSKNIPIISEIELAYRNSSAPVIAVTGTNGKSTTVTLVHEILRRDGYNSRLLGNIGTAYSAEATELTHTDVVSLEVSSFQLCAIETFHPYITCILNISPDHLDYHKNMEEYVRAKFRITVNQNEDDYLILSADNIACEYLKLLDSRARIYFFSTEQRVNGAYLSGGKIYFQDEYIMDAGDIKLLGKHNIANVLAAVCMTKHFGVRTESITAAVKDFKALPHRLQFIGEYGGKKYYNDSKATNTDSALCDIEAFTSPTALLVGGSDKGVEFDGLFINLNPEIKNVIAYGYTAEKFVEAAARCGYGNIIRVNTLREAMGAARDSDCGNVLLAPCCASFDQYNNYKERGDDFINIFNEWASEKR